MRRAVSWLVPALACMCAGPGIADTLVQADGTPATGTLEEVTFLAGEVHGMYARAAIVSLQVAAAGNDLLVLRPQKRRIGTLVSVRFRTAAGVLTVPRAAFRSLELDAESLLPAPAEQPSAQAPSAEQRPDELAAQKKALGTNLSLRNAAWDKAEDLRKEELEALKRRRMDECVKIVREIERIEGTIRNKERKREEAERRWREAERRRRESEKKSGLKTVGRRTKPPQHNDGLEEDRKKLKKAQRDKLELQRDINRDKKQIAERGSLRKKRVESIYGRHRKALNTGHRLTTEQMTANYRLALDIDGKKATDRKKKADSGRKTSGAGKESKKTEKRGKGK